MKASDIEVIDCNHRLGAMPYGKMSVIPPGMDLFGDEALERRRKLLADAGISATVINPVWYYERPNGAADMRAQNDRLAAVIKKAPDIFAAGVGLAEPMHGKAGLDEIRRLDEELGFVGVFYAHTWQGCTVHDPHMYEHFAMLQERKMFALVHAVPDTLAINPPMICEVAAAFPELPMILLEWGSQMQHSAQLLLDGGRHKNLHFDTSSVILPMVRAFIEANGPDQIVFGTDTYSHYTSAHRTPDQVRSVLRPEHSQAVLRDNLLRIIEWTGKPVFGS